MKVKNIYTSLKVFIFEKDTDYTKPDMYLWQGFFSESTCPQNVLNRKVLKLSANENVVIMVKKA